MDITIQLPDNFQEMTIDELLEKDWLVPRKVRHFLRTRKNVMVNGQAVRFHLPVKAGDTLSLHFEQEDYPTPNIYVGDPSLLTILFEDEHLIIVNKPIGVKTHPNEPEESDTLLNQLAGYLAPKGQFPYVVHRLDRETSGCIVFAKNPFVLPIVGQMLEQKKIYRRYQAIVSGKIERPSWTIKKSIGRHRHDRRKYVIDPKKGKPAVTHVEKVSYDQKTNQTAVFCILDTGRTHQIRVHLSNEGFPIVGDPLYGRTSAKRLMLHAYELHLLHPFTKEEIIVQSLPGLW